MTNVLCLAAFELVLRNNAQLVKLAGPPGENDENFTHTLRTCALLSILGSFLGAPEEQNVSQSVSQ